MKKLLSTLVLLLMTFTAHAATLINGIYYNLDSSAKTAEVTSGYRYSGNISIPSTVSYGGYSYRVTSIGYEAFEYCSSITSVTIPTSVTSIGDKAFYGCSGLTSIDIPNSVTSIGDYAFWLCSSLTSVTIPNSVTSIGDYAFWNCDELASLILTNGVKSIGENAFYSCQKLKSVVIPNSVENIGNYAFQYCEKLASITIGSSVANIGKLCFGGCSELTAISVNPLNPNYDSRENCNAIIETSSNTIIATCKESVIPNSIKNIGAFAFWNREDMTTITIPDGVICIGESAFRYCRNLVSINIPNSVTTIGESAFNECTELTSVCIGNSVTSIESYTFNNCSSMTSVSIGNSVTSIAESAFWNCSSLSSVNIPNSVTTIKYVAFARCISLKTVYIGNGLESIQGNSFGGCINLETITVDPSNTHYDSRDNCNAIIETSSNILTLGCKNTTIPNGVTRIGNNAFDGCSGLTSIDIPNSVTSIGEEAFVRCDGLTSVTIPNSVTSIEQYAFYGCSSLTSIVIPCNVTTIGRYAFYDCSSLTSVTVENPSPVTIEQNTFSNRANATLYVPTGSKSAYLAADYWKEFKEIIEKNMSHDAGLGDVNGDGQLTINDVTMLVDYLLEQAPDSFILANADVNKDGRISVSDAVSIIKLILEGEPEPQAYLTCPDGNHPHMIDLGLPSGTKLACCNVGADKPEAYGGYYAWGETEEKSRYYWDTYIHCDGTSSTCHNLGSDIAGTQYDVAHVKWGGSWVMPSLEQINELHNKCVCTWTTVNSIKGSRFTSPNGGTIFVPAAGDRYENKHSNATYCESWSSTQHPSNSYRAIALYFYSGSDFWYGYLPRFYGLPIRPVSK